MKTPRILCVDDETSILDAMRRRLRRAGYQSLAATGGKMALQMLEKEAVDLVLLDLMMPGMDGYETCERIRENPKTKFIPVIMVTAKDSEKDLIAGLDNGAFDYISKPIQEAVFLARIRSALRTKALHDEVLASNKELESFAAVVSHDLQAPLSNIQMYAQTLIKKIPENTDGDFQEWLETIVHNSNLSLVLITDLLNLAKVTNANTIYKTVDHNKVIDEAFTQLQSEILRKKPDIRCAADMPDVFADRSQLIQLYSNLIGNSLKYAKADQAPVIEIGHLNSDDGSPRFFVKDNGIGILPKYHDKIFGVCSRLHGKSSPYKGTGVGLAIVKRIIDRHDGDLWVESDKGQGATFYFTLNKQK